MKRFNAFTLSELLVALGVVGVISALTVPSLINNYQRQSYVTQLHKVYGTVMSALVQYTEDQRGEDLMETDLLSSSMNANSAKAFVKPFLKNYFKITEECENATTPCFAEKYTNINGNSSAALPLGSYYCATLASGASLCMTTLKKEGVAGYKGAWGRIAIDINGQKPPNIGGRDMFSMIYYHDGTIDGESVNPENKAKNNFNIRTQRNTNFTKDCLKSTNGYGCFDSILNNNWKMTY